MHCDPAKLQRRINGHDVLFSQPLGKSRPQPQVLVPLRGPAASQPAVAPTIQQAQQRAAVLTASAKAAQAFISSAGPKKSCPGPAPPPPLPRIATIQSGKLLKYHVRKRTCSRNFLFSRSLHQLHPSGNRRDRSGQRSDHYPP